MPFGGDPSRGGVKVLGNPVVKEVATRYGRDPGQVLVSWGIKVRCEIPPPFSAALCKLSQHFSRTCLCIFEICNVSLTLILDSADSLSCQSQSSRLESSPTSRLLTWMMKGKYKPYEE